jgi:ribulose kinase
MHAHLAQDLAAKWPDKVLALGDTVGGLTAAAASHLGLKQGTPVAQVSMHVCFKFGKNG